jgi:hypothetical protein
VCMVRGCVGRRGVEASQRESVCVYGAWVRREEGSGRRGDPRQGLVWLDGPGIAVNGCGHAARPGRVFCTKTRKNRLNGPVSLHCCSHRMARWGPGDFWVLGLIVGHSCARRGAIAEAWSQAMRGETGTAVKWVSALCMGAVSRRGSGLGGR